MASLLLVAHAPLASALLAVARHVYPDCTTVLTAVDVQADASLDEVRALLRSTLASLPVAPGAGVLILTDVFGATPCNAALAVADTPQVRVVAGVNVPMLWRALCYASQPLDDLVARATAGATQGVMQVAVPRRQNQPVPPGSHDPVQHHDQ